MAERFTGLRGRMITRKQAAELLDVSESTVTRLIEDHDLVAFRIRRQLKISRASLERYLMEQAHTPPHDEHLASRVTESRRTRNREIQSGTPGTQLHLLLGES